MSSKSPTVSVARWSATHPWRAIGLWVAFVVSAIALMSTVQTKQVADEDFRVGESGRAAAMIDDAGLAASPTESVLITAPTGLARLAPRPRPPPRRSRRPQQTSRASPTSDHRSGRRNATRCSCRSRWPVTSTTPPTMSSALIDADRQGPEGQPVARRRAGRRRVARRRHQRQGRRGPGVGGVDEPADHVPDPARRVRRVHRGRHPGAAGDLRRCSPALGLYAPMSYLVPDSGTVANVVLLIGMAVGVDYSLFYLKREREERMRGRSTVDADRDRGGDLGPRRRGLRLRRRRLDVRAVHHPRAGLQRPRRRLDPRGRRRRDRLADRAAGSAGQARPLGRPSAHPAAVAPQPAHRRGWHQRSPDPPGHPQARWPRP